MQKSRNGEKSKNNNLNSRIQTLISKSHNSSLTTHHSGITLIALVVTVVVLLILAGVTITLMFGENSIFDMAKDASIETKLGELEDKAGVIYSNLVTEKYKTNSNQAITTSDVVNKLEGYEINEVQLAENAITGIEIEGLTDNKITLVLDETKELTINPITSEGGYAYFAVIDGKNYEIKLEKGKLKVSREPQEVEGETPTTTELKIEKLEGTTVTASKKEDEEKTIVLQAGKIAGNTKIKVTYGGKPLEFIAVVEIKPSENSTASGTSTFTGARGTIEVIWLQGETNTVSSTPNEPHLYDGALTPVTWSPNGTTWSEDEKTTTDTKVAKKTWYNYRTVDEEETSTADNLTSYWANAKNSDGSYFVWIPRYAYRITYYNEESTEPVGYYDGYGRWNAATGSIDYALEDGIETITHNGNKYIVHPAFGAEDSSKQAANIEQGGWGEPITGFWVSKFEISGETNKVASEPGNVETTDTIKAVSKPGVSSWRSIDVGKCYTNSFKYDRNKESHLIKNSEWGAVAYLTHSQYGRNAHEIGFSKTGYYTGGTQGEAAYMGSTNSLQSTTGNAYGVYDMRGGAYEYTASFAKNGSDLTNGNSFTSAKTSTKYATAYNGTSNYSGTDVYTVCKTGDGIKEVYVSGTAGWHKDYSYFAYSGIPFFERGGYYGSNEAYSGVFYSGSSYGVSLSYYGFRAVLCP